MIKPQTNSKIIVAMPPNNTSLRSVYAKRARGKPKKKKVIIAMSGGIDSSVAAALLKQEGFDIIGVFMKFWSEDTKLAENRCCSPKAETRARKVASILEIPFYVFDFRKEFKKRIVDYFLEEYKAGKTPNPCVVCNKEIKFGLLLEKALKMDTDYVATGHYSRLRREIPNSKFQIPKIKLLKGKDKEKDQSYFLWQLNQKQLSRILFPIGDYIKSEVRKLAKKLKLPVLDIPESMEICFIQTTINDFLKRHLKSKSGKIICLTSDVKQGFEGKVVGEHQGLWFYTIGQRKGIGLAGGPYWILDKDIKNNILIVTKNEKDLYKKELIAKSVNWISGKEPLHQNKFGAGQAKLPLKVKVKIRYRHFPASAVLAYNLKSKIYNLKFDKAQRAITPGQSVAFYQGQELLGGGIIC